MPELRMVRLVTAANPMEARIIAARLGSEGIVWQFQGSVDGPFAMGPVEILVDQGGYEQAREMLLADDVESSFEVHDGAPPRETTARDVLWLAAIVAVFVVFVIVRIASPV